MSIFIKTTAKTEKRGDQIKINHYFICDTPKQYGFYGKTTIFALEFKIITMTSNKGSVAILCGGGPAPGINAVVGSVAKAFIQDGYTVLGIHDGYFGLFSEERSVVNINFALADRIHSTGGSYLRMSRFKPKDSDFTSQFFTDNNVKLLITVGGDDTASTANRISKYLISQNVKIQNIHVPKTIDNDLPLAEDQFTFGYQSAKEEGCRIATTVYEDARTSANWFVVAVMGREAGHLAFGIGSACHYPMIIMPEMFYNTSVTFEKITDLIVSSIIKRRILGINYGAAMVSEGVFHFMSDEQVISSGIDFTYDDHGHPELGNVSKAHIFNMMLSRKLKELKLPVKSRPVELGYELRCISPVGFDKEYCAMLGMGTKELFDQGVSGAMVTVSSKGNIAPLYLKDVEDENGKVKPRLVNIHSENAQTVFKMNMQYITEADYEEAKKYVSDPETYDFHKILKWK